MLRWAVCLGLLIGRAYAATVSGHVTDPQGRPVGDAAVALICGARTETRTTAEYTEVGRRPLGDGFSSAPVREFRGAIARAFHEGRMEGAVNFMVASGFAGQTTEVLGVEQVVGVRLPSCASASWTWHPRAHRTR